MSVIFVTHDIGVAIEICDRVAVMYAGQIVEQGTLAQIVAAGASLCAWTVASTVHGASAASGSKPSRDAAFARLTPVDCSFAPRCSFAQPRCVEQLPPSADVVGPDRALHPGQPAPAAIVT